MSRSPLARRRVICAISTSSLAPGLLPSRLTTLANRGFNEQSNAPASADFIQLSSLRLLPQETRNYVPAVLSAMQLLGVSYLPIEPRQTAKRSDPNGVIFAVPGAQP